MWRAMIGGKTFTRQLAGQSVGCHWTVKMVPTRDHVDPLRQLVCEASTLAPPTASVCAYGLRYAGHVVPPPPPAPGAAGASLPRNLKTVWCFFHALVTVKFPCACSFASSFHPSPSPPSLRASSHPSHQQSTAPTPTCPSSA